MNENEFLKTIEAEPANPVPRLVYADWLDEQGDLRGELLRIQEELRRIDVPNRAAKEARMQELLKEGVKPLVITPHDVDWCRLGFDLPGRICDGERSRGRRPI